MMQNKFLLSSRRSPDTRPWAIHDETGNSFPGAVYFARILAELDAAIGRRGLTFLATDDVKNIPISGEDVVVLVHEDEWCRIPAYADRVRMVFKTFGTALRWADNPISNPTPQAFLSSLQDLRTEVRRIPSRLQSSRRESVFDIPLGYCRQLDRTPMPINERPHDIYFGGTVKSQRSFKKSFLSAVDTPKNLSRSEMLDRLERIRADHPEFSIEANVTQTFHDLSEAQITHYSDTMMATKICLVPRGSNLETWRFFEGLRYGCAVIAERLPYRWYYEGAPVEQVDSWDDLESVVLKLLRDQTALQRRQNESLAWWRDVCSERTVAEHMQRCLFGRPAPGARRRFTVKQRSRNTEGDS